MAMVKKEVKYKEKYHPIKFPKDGQKHDHIIEWWYFNGNLKAKNGKTFSYMNCLFAAKPDKVDIPFLKNGFIKELFFSHYLLSNNDKEFKNKTNPLCVIDPNSFTKPMLWVNYDNSCLIEEIEPFKYHIVNDFIDLYLESDKRPLLVNKTGFLDLKIKTTYYYSLTRLRTKGLVKEKDKWIPVEGLSWMDHQWAQTPLTDDDKWKWFSIQLENDCDIVCFVYGDKIKTGHASMIDENCIIKKTKKIDIVPTGIKYKNKKTGGEYDLQYEINIPEFKIKLKTTPFKKEQEMVFETIKYWEGGIGVEGTMNDEKVSGKGFCELVTEPRESIAKYIIGKAKNPMKNIQTISDLSIKSIYLLSQKKRK
ncbi:MAG: lipocalin-like domain-containing protein [Candidatus Paceibacterota bacterium]|jgi:predicted secreted hydrolase